MIRIGQLLRIYQQTDRWSQPINRWSVTDYGLVDENFYDEIVEFQNFKWPENTITPIVKNLLLETPIPNIKNGQIDPKCIIEMHYISNGGLKIGDVIKDLKAKYLIQPWIPFGFGHRLLAADFINWEVAVINFERLMRLNGHRAVWEINIRQKNMLGHNREMVILGEQHLFKWPISWVIKRFFLNIYCKIKNLFFDI